MNYSIEEERGFGSETTPLLQTGQTSEGRCVQRLKESCKKVLPLLMVSGAGLIFSIQAVLSKLMPIPPGEYVFMEATFNIPFCLLVCFHSGVNISPPNPLKRRNGWFWGRVIFGGLASGGKILVVRNMNIGDATAIIFSAPIWAGLLARIILKEKYTIVNLFAAIFGLVGIILIAKPGILFHDVSNPGQSTLPWACATLGVSIIAAVSYVCVRATGDDVHPMNFVLYTAIVELICGLLINPAMKQAIVLPPCNWVRGALLACGVGATVANLLIVRGLALENSGPATLMRNWDTVYAYIFQIIFFSVTPDWISVLGAVLIVSTALLQGIDRLVDISCGISF